MTIEVIGFRDASTGGLQLLPKFVDLCLEFVDFRLEFVDFRLELVVLLFEFASASWRRRKGDNLLGGVCKNGL